MAGEYIFQMYKLVEGLPARPRGAQGHLAVVPARAPRSACSATTAPGKSSLLRDHGRAATASSAATPQLAPGASVGLLEQEPALDETRTCARTCSTASATCARSSTASTSSPPTTPTRRPTSSRACRTQIDAADAWNLDGMIEHAMDALRCPPGDAAVATLSGGERRRVALCRLLLSQPDLLLLDEPTNHLDAESVEWLERHLAEYRGTVVAVTHDRYFLDNVAGWILELDRGRGHPLPGQLLGLARAEAGAPRAVRRAGARPPAHDRRRARMGPHEPEGPPQQVEGAARQLRGAARAGGRGQARPGPDPHPGRPAARRPRDRGERPAQGLRRAAADRRTSRSRCRAAASSA